MAIAFSYVRFSTRKQRVGHSLRRQVDLSKNYAERHGLTLDEELCFLDLGVSAYNKENLEKGALGKFLDAVERGIVPSGSYLLVESFDRLSRSQVLNALNIFLRIINNGITVVTLSDERKYSKESLEKNYFDLIISITLMARAYEESHAKSLRIKSAWESKRKQAVECGRVFTKRCPFWLRAKNCQSGYEIVDEWASLVHRIYLMAKEGYGSAYIAKTLNADEIKTPRGKQWDKSNVAQILRTREVLGEAAFSKENPTYYPQVISHELFSEVRALVAARTKKRGATLQTMGVLPGE